MPGSNANTSMMNMTSNLPGPVGSCCLAMAVLPSLRGQRGGAPCLPTSTRAQVGAGAGMAGYLKDGGIDWKESTKSITH